MRCRSTIPPRVWLAARLALFLVGFGLRWTTFAAAGKVDLVRTPNDGIQPQALVDVRGTHHLIYFKGDPQGGNVFYVRQEPGKESFSAPMRVNTQDRCAVAVGTIRGAQMALGRNGRVHVAWNSNHASGKHRGPAMFYTRLNDAQTGFELERDLITHAAGLDGGGSVAADDRGNVYAVWHAPTSDADEGEAMRAVFAARSSDDGKIFSRETQAHPASHRRLRLLRPPGVRGPPRGRFCPLPCGHGQSEPGRNPAGVAQPGREL